MSKEQLQEFKSDHEDSEIMDPIDTGDAQKNRSKDKKGTTLAAKGEAPKDVKTPGPKYTPRPADKTKMEELLNNFGDDLSEAFKEKVSTLWAAALEEAVNEVIAEKYAELEEKFETKLQESLETRVTELTENVDSYIDYAMKEWIAENQISFDKNIRLSIAESFINDLKGLFEKHNFNVSDEETSMIEEMAEKITELTDSLNESADEIIVLKGKLLETKLHDTFSEVADGLTESQVERFEALTENIDFRDIEDYKNKISIIKENFFTKSDAGKKVITEDAELEPYREEIVEDNSGPVNHYVKSIDRLFG